MLGVELFNRFSTCLAVGFGLHPGLLQFVGNRFELLLTLLGGRLQFFDSLARFFDIADMFLLLFGKVFELTLQGGDRVVSTGQFGGQFLDVLVGFLQALVGGAGAAL